MHNINKKMLFIVFISVMILGLFLFCDSAYAITADLNLYKVFKSETENWIHILSSYTKSLFVLLFTIDIALFGIGVALKRTPMEDVIQQFVMTLLFVGFIIAVINNYQSWTQELITGMTGISQKIYGEQIGTVSPLILGLQLAMSVIDNMSVFSPAKSLGYLSTGIILLIVFALLTAQIIFIKCESLVAMAAAILLLGFAGLTQTKDYALNVIRYVISVAFKLFVLELVLGIGMNFIGNDVVAEPEFLDLFTLIGASVILYVLVKSLPDTISGIINGSHVSSGHQLSGAVAAIGSAMVGGAAAAAIGGFGMGRAVKAASTMAKEEGHTGLGRAGQTVKNLADSFG